MMPTSRLRLYRGPETVVQHESDDDSRVTLSVAEVLPLLADAVNSNRTWLRDFAHDEITIPADLYEVLSAYQYLRRPVA